MGILRWLLGAKAKQTQGTEPTNNEPQPAAIATKSTNQATSGKTSKMKKSKRNATLAKQKKKDKHQESVDICYEYSDTSLPNGVVSGFGFSDGNKKDMSDDLAEAATERLLREGVLIGPDEQKQIDDWAQAQIDEYTKPQPIMVDPDWKPAEKKVRDNGEQTDVKCPHCKHLFEKMPRAKRKCPECKEMVFPRCPPGKKWKRLVSEKQAEKWKISANRRQSRSWYRQKVREFRSEIKDGCIDDSFDFIATADSCDICKDLERNSPYKLDDLPQPVIDTHPFCRCCVSPHI